MASGCLQVLPMYHLAGWVVAFLPLDPGRRGRACCPSIGFDARTVGVGGGVLLGRCRGSSRGPPRRPNRRWQAAHDHRVTVIPGAPGFFHHLVRVAGRRARAVLGPAAHLRDRAAGTRRLRPGRKLLGQPVWEGYGLSESASVVTSSLATSKPHLGSVGRPLPGIELRVIGPDGADAGPDGRPADRR